MIEINESVKEDDIDNSGAKSDPKTSGATGIHICVPLGAKYTYGQAHEFARIVAMHAHDQLPTLTSLERSLSKRGKNNSYIDYLQNSKDQTLRRAYSLRPKPGATVSTPLDWSQIKKDCTPPILP